jgi:hypothetical protein
MQQVRSTQLACRRRLLVACVIDGGGGARGPVLPAGLTRTQISFLDCLGCERVSKVGLDVHRPIRISMGNSAILNCLRALGEAGRHVPYRDSKESRLLLVRPRQGAGWMVA